MLNKKRDIFRTSRDRNAIPSAIPTKSWVADLMVIRKLGQRSPKVGHAHISRTDRDSNAISSSILLYQVIKKTKTANMNAKNFTVYPSLTSSESLA